MNEPEEPNASAIQPQQDSVQRWGSNTRKGSQQSGRDSILDAAISCYLDSGVAGTTIDDIALRAKISRRTVYRYFANKQAVMQAVVESQAVAFFAQLDNAVRRYRDDFPQLLKRSMLYTIDHGPQAPAHKLLMGNNDNVAISSQHYFYSETIKLAWQQLLREPFERAQARGDINSATGFEQLAAWTRRLLMSYILFPETKQSVAADIDNFVLQVLRP
jgi:AcrR family transcriptional regulator